MSKEYPSWPEIENGLWKLQFYARTNFGREGELAAQDVIWYVTTGRASVDFIRALLKCRKSALLPKIVKVWDCTEKVVSETKKHLRIKE